MYVVILGIYPWGKECFTWRQFSLFCLTICWRFSLVSNLLVEFRFKEDVLDRLDFNVLLFLIDDGRVELWMHEFGPLKKISYVRIWYDIYILASCLFTQFPIVFTTFYLRHDNIARAAPGPAPVQSAAVLAGEWRITRVAWTLLK